MTEAKKKPIPEARILLWERVAAISAGRAKNTALPVALRSYYAGVALFYDNKVTRAREDQ